MKTYFSSLIQQTGIKLGQQEENKAYHHQGSDTTSGQPAVPSDQPEAWETEEFIEVRPPADATAPNRHEAARSVEEENVRPSITPDKPKTRGIEKTIEVAAPSGAVASDHHEAAKRVKQEPSSPPEGLQERKAPPPPEIVIPQKPVAAGKREHILEKAAETADTDMAQTDAPFPNKEVEPPVEAPPQTGPVEKVRLVEAPPVSEPSTIVETTASLSPSPLERHVVIAPLPDTYQQIIKEWLVSPADESRDQPFDKEKLQASIKRKQNSKVVLKPKPAPADYFPEKKIGDEQPKTGELHLSVDNINLTIEAPEPVNRHSPKVSDRPARRQQAGSSRLSRHYVRIR